MIREMTSWKDSERGKSEEEENTIKGCKRKTETEIRL